MMASRYLPWHNAGSEVMAHELLRALVEADHDVDVLCTVDSSGCQPYDLDGVTVYPARRPKADPFAWFASAEHRPDVVVTHLENTHRASVLARRYGVPHVVLMHNDHLECREYLRIARPQLVVFNSHWLAQRCEDWWRARWQVPVPPSLVVHPPVEPTRYATTPGEAITLVNLSEDKGAGVFYALAQRFPRRQFLGVQGAYGPQQIEPRSNVAFVHHIAPTAMRDQVYRRTKVLLMPSSYESYGRVGAEALCSGIPVIAHPTAGLREALGDGGVFVDRDDLDGWEKTLRRLLTPRGWHAASKRALRQAKRLEPADELKTLVSTVEEVARCLVRW